MGPGGRLSVLTRHVAAAAAPEPALPFAGKVVLVTGASRGIGREIAVAAAARGARVAVHYNTSSSGAAATVQLLQGHDQGRHRAFGVSDLLVC